MLSLAGICAASAAPKLTQVTGGTLHQALLGVAFDGKVGVAVGAGGEIQATQDGGATWTRAASPSPLTLLGVDVRESLGVAVGQMGLILVRDGGSGWAQMASGTQERLLSVSINARGDAIAVGSFGTVLASSDRGRSWTSIAPDWMSFMAAQGEGFQPHLYAVQLDDQGTATVVGELGTILRYSADSRQWTLLHKGDPVNHKDDASLFALDIRADGIGYAVGQDGTILRSSDGGLSWRSTRLAAKSILLGVSSAANGHVLITAMHAMYFSRDDGKTWRRFTDAAVASSWYVGVARPEGGTPLVVGNAGKILRFE
ncbi:photosystem II stability/assembly factor-like protein [Solimonas sp. K1W22B-7]|nr:photosystem II stability/assembly factor-like protein [Solimonas sp. K1W22B-7]